MCVYKVVTCNVRTHFPGAEKLVGLVSTKSTKGIKIYFRVLYLTVGVVSFNSARRDESNDI